MRNWHDSEIQTGYKQAETEIKHSQKAVELEKNKRFINTLVFLKFFLYFFALK